VRGFGENQLGPRVLTVDPAELLVEDKCTVAQVSDGSCDPNLFPVDAFIPRPLGGSSVLEASVEYRFPLFGPFVGAAFLDGALVSGTLEGFVEDAVGAVTPGVGIRYQSPIVPIRVDVGYRPALSQLLPVFTEVVDANGESRLVRLAQPRLYDPVGDATGGFLGGIFSHLRLHVWIGEAF
jgi:hypothetical protein